MNQFTKKSKALGKFRVIHFQIGLIITGGLTLVAFEWTTPINPYDLPETDVIYEEEWEMPPIFPEKEIKKPEVKFTEARKKSETFIIVKELPEPTPEPSPEPTPDPKFDPDKWAPTEPYVDPNPAPLPMAEIMPEFKGGVEELFKYLCENIKYPARERDAGIQGTVYLRFVVGKKGNIKNVEVLRGVNEQINNEAIRVVKAMPKWKPGKQSGRPVSVIYNLPIKFKLVG